MIYYNPSTNKLIIFKGYYGDELEVIDSNIGNLGKCFYIGEL